MLFDLTSWLKKIGLHKFEDELKARGYTTPDRLGSILNEDWDDMGFSRAEERRLTAELSELETSQENEIVDLSKELPTYLAIPLTAYVEETHPRIKLLWMCDTVELMVRFAVIVLLAEIRSAQKDSTLPDGVKAVLSEKIERPTFGAWLNLLRDLLEKYRPEHQKVSARLLEWMTNPLDENKNLANVINPKPDDSESGGALDFLALRNLLAHGGGISINAAKVRHEEYKDRFISLMQSLNQAMVDLSVIALDGDKTWSLKSNTPHPITRPDLGVLANETSKTWLVGLSAAIELTPLLRYETIRHPLTKEAGETASQCYFRGTRTRQEYTPLGSDAMVSSFEETIFFDLFLKIDQTRQKQYVGYAWNNFIAEARSFSGGMVGRAAPLKALKDWRKAIDPFDEKTPQIGWFTGQPGTGKSMLMAKLAADLSNGKSGVYYHRFKAGDSRNNRGDFLRFLAEALMGWLDPKIDVESLDEKDTPEERVHALLDRIPKLKGPNDKSPAFTLILDGLDEITAHDPEFTNLILRLALPGSIWILSSRSTLGKDFGPYPIPGLTELKGMDTADIRTMFLQVLDGGKATGLLTQDADRDDNEAPSNAFIDAILAKADGLPLYVHYVIEDILSNQKKFDKDTLPEGLTAYYKEMLGRLEISDEKERLHHVIAVLACSEESLDSMALTQLLSDSGEEVKDEYQFMERVLRLGGALLKETQTVDDTLGHTLYHSSFRDFVTENNSPLKRTIKKARERLYEKAASWHTLPQGTLRNHILRQGNRYAIDWQPDGVGVVQKRLTDFGWLMARLEYPVTTRLDDLIDDYLTIKQKRGANGSHADDFDVWLGFMLRRRHLLNRAQGPGVANRILLQLATEHADNSPITQRAEEWLEQGICNWLWLKDQHRPQRLEPDPCLLVLQENETEPVLGALSLPDSKLLSWSEDHILRLWDAKSGTQIAKLEGHTAKINGAQLLTDGRIVSWSDDGTVQTWGPPHHAPVTSLNSHRSPVIGIHIFSDDRIVAWSKNGTICEWEGQSNTPSIFESQPNDVGNKIQWDVLSTRALTDGRLLFCINVINFYDTTEYEDFDESSGEYRHSYQVTEQRISTQLYQWQENQLQHLATLAYGNGDYNERSIKGAEILADGRILTWGFNGDSYPEYPHDLQLLDSDGNSLWPKKRYENPIKGAQVHSDGRIAYWMRESSSIYLLNDAYSEPLKLSGHEGAITGLRILRDGRIFSWSEDATLCLWNGSEEKPVAILRGHSGGINGADIFADGRIFSWSQDGSIRLWDAQRNTALGKGQRDSVKGAITLSDGRILSWSEDFHLGVWNSDNGDCLRWWPGHTASILGTAELPNGQLLSWSLDGSLKIWDPHNFECVAVRDEGSCSLSDVQVLANGRILYHRHCRDDENWPPEEAYLVVWDRFDDSVINLNLESDSGYDEPLPVPLVLTDGRFLVWGNSYSRSEIRKKSNNWFKPTQYDLVVMDSAVGNEPISLEGHTEKIRGAIAVENDRVLSWSDDKTLRLWDANTGKCLNEWPAHTDSIQGAKILSNNQFLTWSEDHNLRVRSTKDNTLLIELSGHTDSIKGVQVFEDCRVLSWSDDHTLRIWNTQSGECLAVLMGHTDTIAQVQILNANQIITCARDHTLRLWDIQKAYCQKKWHLDFLHIGGDADVQSKTLHALYSLFSGYESDAHLAMGAEGSSSEIITIARNGLMTLKTDRNQLRFMQVHYCKQKMTIPDSAISPMHM